MKHPTITREEVLAVVSYDPTTGLFRRTTDIVRGRARRWRGEVTGNDAGNGYFHISIYCRSYKAHRLAWFIVHGRWPACEIDHIDGNPSNNRIANLREATHVENSRNRIRVGSSTGVMGVQRKGDKYTAAIGRDYDHYYLGIYQTPDEASAAYWRARGEGDLKNHANRRGLMLGVSWDKKRQMWRAQIKIRRHGTRKTWEIGCFTTPEESHEAFLMAKRDIDVRMALAPWPAALAKR